jgi:hypothetical protein
MVLVINAIKVTKSAAPRTWNECFFADTAEDFTCYYQFGSIPCILYHVTVNGCLQKLRVFISRFLYFNLIIPYGFSSIVCWI